MRSTWINSLFKRFMVLICDLCWGRLLYFFILQLPSFDRVQGFLLFHGLDDPYRRWLLIYVLAMLWRLSTTLIFGMGVSHFFMGFSSVGPFLERRLAGMSRVILEAFSNLLLFGPLLTVIRREGPAERWSDQRLYCYAGLKYELMSYAFIIFSFVLGLVAPLGASPYRLQSVELGEAKIRPDPEVKMGVGGIVEARSNIFHFKADQNLEDLGFYLIPNMLLKLDRGRKKLRPYLSIYHQESDALGHLDHGENLLLLDMLAKFKREHFLFVDRYPELNKILERSWEFQGRVKKLAHEKAPYKMSKQATREIIQIFRRSLELRLDKVHDFWLNEDNFLLPYVELKQKILSTLDPQDFPEADILWIKDFAFLRFRQILRASPKEEASLAETYWPLSTTNPKVVQLKWDAKLMKSQSKKKFLKSLWGTSEWYFDFEEPFAFPEYDDQLSSFTILDFFFNEQLDQKQRRRLEKFITGHLYSLGSLAVKEEKAVLRQMLMAQLEKLIQFVEFRNQKNAKFFLEQFESLLRRMHKGLKNNDHEFYRRGD